MSDRLHRVRRRKGRVETARAVTGDGDEIEALGLSIAAFAKALGVTRQRLYRLINGDCGISPEMAIRVELVLGGSADVWLRLQMNYDLAQIRNRSGELGLKRLPR